MEKLRLSHSRISTWQHCHLEYKYNYLDNLSPKEKKVPLQVGDIVHQLLHLWYSNKLKVEDITNLNEFVQKVYPENSEELSLDIAIQSAGLVKGYLTKYAEDTLKFIPGETSLEWDIGCCILNGKVDAYARPQDGRLWRIEHKTTAKMDSYYLNGLKGGLQGAIYDYLSEKLFNESITGTIYNLLVKTKIPDYHRAYTKCNPRAIERMLQTVEGVAKEVQTGDFYPSSRCFSYNSECSYKVLCEYDSEEVRNTFFVERKEVQVEENEKKGGETE